MKAKFLRLNARDFFKGMIIAIIAAVITFLTNELQAGTTIDLKRIGITALIAFLSYLVKNLFTNSKDEILTPEK